jgi:HicA toxin of bacterial toxin-antitoxin,
MTKDEAQRNRWTFYEAVNLVRQRGSHVRLEKSTPAGIHKITISLHDQVAKGTLKDILTKVSIWNQIPKEDLIEKL